MQPTRKLYEETPTLAEFSATVLASAPCPGPNNWAVVLDATAFFPEGGGQPCDTGTLGGCAVTGVTISAEGVISHRLTGSSPAVGAVVSGTLDWPARLDHMQQHTGEHILSGLLHSLYGAENVGFHIGEDAVRMDLDLPLTAAQLAEAELAANAVVRRDVPVRCRYPGPAELAATAYRSKKELDGAVRLVEIPGADCCACCGTHLARTGEVGLIKILSFQHYKGGVRLAVACGARACRAVCAVQDDAAAAGVLLSAAPGVLAPAVTRLLAAQTAEKQRAAALQESLLQALCAAAVPGQPQLRLLDGPDGDGLRRLCLALAGAAGAPCALFAPGGQGIAYALAAPAGGDIRPVCRALNETFAGRGGGKPAFCQGSLPPTDFAVLEDFLRGLLV